MSYFVDPNSSDATKSELAFFSVPQTQTVIKNTYYDVIKPMAVGGNEGPWKFRIPQGPQFLQCNSIFVYFRITILQANDANLAANNRVAPINLIGKTLFKQVKMKLGGQDLYDSGDNYAYKSYFETQFMYPEDAKNTHLNIQGYEKDETTLDAEGNEVAIDSRDNPSFEKKRKKFFYGGANHSAEFIGFLHTPITTQEKALIDDAALEIELYRNSDSFCLLHFPDPNQDVAQNFKIKVDEIELYVMKREVPQWFRLELRRQMTKKPVRYAVRRSLQTNVHIAAGVRSAPTHTLWQGQLPRRMIIGFVATAAYYGNYQLSPFNFKPYDVRSLKIKINENTYPDKNGLSMNFDQGRYALAYRSTLDALDLWNGANTNAITLNNFKSGDTVFVINLTPDQHDAGHFSLLTEGHVSADIEFGRAIPQGGVEMIIWMEFDNMIYLDVNRNFKPDYAI